MADSFGFDRISTISRDKYLLGDIQRVNKRIMDTTSQLTSGKRVRKPSDDAIASTRALGLARLRDDSAQYNTNIQFGRGRLETAENSLDQINELFNRTRDILLTQLQAPFTTQTATQASQSIQLLLEEAVDIANQKYENEYIFGGQNTENPPFEVLADGSVRYNGDRQAVTVPISDLVNSQVTLTGPEAFSAFSTTVTGSADLDPNVNGTTKLSVLNQGLGVSSGKIRVTTDVTGGSVTTVVDLTRTTNLQDVVDRINQDTGLTMTIDGATGDRLTVTGGTTLNIEEEDSTTARDLGLLTSGSVAAPFTGTDLDPALNSLTPMSLLLNGAGLTDLTPTIVITNGNDTATVDLSSAQTLQDAFNLIEQADVDVFAEINSTGSGIDIISRRSGATLIVAESGAGTAASELGILTAGTGVKTDSVFGLWGEIETAVGAGNIPTMSTLGDLMESMQDVLLSARAEVGGRVIRMDLTEMRHLDEQTFLDGLTSELVDVDLAEASMNFQRDQTLLQAALQATAKTLRLSILDYI